MQNNLTPIQPEFSQDGLPIFLGDPNAKPDPKFPEHPWNIFLAALGIILEEYPHLSPDPEDYLARQFFECATLIPALELETSFLRWTRSRGFWHGGPQEAWAALIQALRPAKRIGEFIIQQPTALPHRPHQKTNHHDAPAQEITRQPIVNPSPIPTTNPEKANLIPIKKLQQPLSRPTFLADQWKLDSRWAQLTPCAVAVFYALLWRTYQKATFKKITQAFGQGRTWFPWCLKGIESLSKKLTYTTKGKKITKHYKSWAIKAAIKQLEQLGFISTLFRGYKGQGAGKCFVFLNPKMSSAFHRESRRHKPRSRR